MSITYDPVKWSNPFKTRDFGPVKKRSNAPVLVSLRELRYFNEHSESTPKSISAFIKEEQTENPEIDSNQMNEA